MQPFLRAVEQGTQDAVQSVRIAAAWALAAVTQAVKQASLGTQLASSETEAAAAIVAHGAASSTASLQH